jgi:hypothetical protein
MAKFHDPPGRYGAFSCYLMATAVSDSPGCQPPPSALKAATAARADSAFACARSSEARSKFSSACRTSMRLTTPF